MRLPADLTIEDLPPEQTELAELIGIDAYLKLVERYGGLRAIYIPSLKEIERRDRNDMIRQQFDGYNYVELARAYGLTEQTIRNIVADIAPGLRRRPLPGQYTFLDGN